MEGPQVRDCGDTACLEHAQQCCGTLHPPPFNTTGLHLETRQALRRSTINSLAGPSLLETETRQELQKRPHELPQVLLIGSATRRTSEPSVDKIKRVIGRPRRQEDQARPGPRPAARPQILHRDGGAFSVEYTKAVIHGGDSVNAASIPAMQATFKVLGASPARRG